jgi:ankyrin repeat protein
MQRHETPLHLACLFGYEDIVSALLNYGANVEAKTLVTFSYPYHSQTFYFCFDRRNFAPPCITQLYSVDQVLHKSYWNMDQILRAVIE